MLVAASVTIMVMAVAEWWGVVLQPESARNFSIYKFIYSSRLYMSIPPFSKSASLLLGMRFYLDDLFILISVTRFINILTSVF